MEFNISSSNGNDVSSRISFELSPVKDILSASEPNMDWDCSMYKDKQSSTLKEPSSAELLYPSEPDVPRPRPRVRYQRRNSAVASMLFPAASNASRNFPSFLSSDGNAGPLHLSTRIRHIGLSEALMKAQELVQHSPSISPPPLEGDEIPGKMLKRVSLPWSQKYEEKVPPDLEETTSGSDVTEEGKRKRQRT